MPHLALCLLLHLVTWSQLDSLQVNMSIVSWLWQHSQIADGGQKRVSGLNSIGMPWQLSIQHANDNKLCVMLCKMSHHLGSQKHDAVQTWPPLALAVAGKASHCAACSICLLDLSVYVGFASDRDQRILFKSLNSSPPSCFAPLNRRLLIQLVCSRSLAL